MAGFAWMNEVQAPGSKLLGMTLLMSTYFFMLSIYSLCRHVGTGTRRSFTSNVSWELLEKSPRMFLQTRPVTIVLDWCAGADGVDEDEANVHESIP